MNVVPTLQNAFEFKGNVSDSSGRCTPTVTGGVTTTTSTPSGGGAVFTRGSTQRVGYGTLTSRSKSMTITCFFTCSSLPVDTQDSRRIVTKGSDHTNANTAWELGVIQNGSFQNVVRVRYHGVEREGTTQLANVTRYFFALRFNAATDNAQGVLDFFLDGTSQGSVGNITIPSRRNDWPVTIGNTPPGSATALPFGGTIESVCVWNRALSNSDLTQVRSGVTTPSTVSHFSWSSGTGMSTGDQTATALGIEGSNPKTVMTWFRMDYIGGVVMCLGSTSVTYGTFGFGYAQDNNLWRIQLNNNDIYVDLSTVVFADEWYHMALSYDGNNIKLYVDGVQQHHSSIGSILVTGDEFPLLAARVPVNSWYFAYGVGRMALADMRVYDRALGQSEMTTIAHSYGRDGVVYGLRGRWMLRQGPTSILIPSTSTITNLGGSWAVGSTVPSSPVGKNRMMIVTAYLVSDFLTGGGHNGITSITYGGQELQYVGSGGWNEPSQYTARMYVFVLGERGIQEATSTAIATTTDDDTKVQEIVYASAFFGNIQPPTPTHPPAMVMSNMQEQETGSVHMGTLPSGEVGLPFYETSSIAGCLLVGAVGFRRATTALVPSVEEGPATIKAVSAAGDTNVRVVGTAVVGTAGNPLSISTGVTGESIRGCGVSVVFNPYQRITNVAAEFEEGDFWADTWVQTQESPLLGV